MNKIKNYTHNLTFNIITATTVLLFIFCMVVLTIGYAKFTDSLTNEYTDSAYRTADTAETLVKSDNLSVYLENKDSILANEDTELVREYYQSMERLDILCNKQNVTVIYVIQVAEDYDTYTCIFNCPNKNSGYTPWEIGKVVTTSSTAGSYRDVYVDIYEHDHTHGTVMRTTNLNGAAPHITSLLALKNSDGTIAGIMCVQRPMSELSAGRRSYMVIVAVFTVILAVLYIIVSTLFMKKQFVNPIKKIKDEAARFAKDNSAPDKPVLNNISRINEISSLALALDEMETETLKYIDNLSVAIAEKQRMGAELNIARLIQEGSLSSIFPAFPDRKEFDLYASMDPAKEVGGDFYDFFLIDDDNLALVMADVSGKGVPAALFMMVTKILINDRAIMGGTPAEILEFVNEHLCEHNKADMFVTVWLGILEISSGKFTFSNAGHEDPAIMQNGKEFKLEKRKHGFIMGAMKGVKYTDSEITLGKGDKVFLYTDGVPEATDKNVCLFTVDGMVNALNEVKDESPEMIINGVRRKIDEFVGDAPQFDDITMLCLEYRGKAERSITVVAQDDNLEKATQFIINCVKDAHVSEKFLHQVELCIEEIFVNVAHYAYAPDKGNVEICAEIKDGVLIIKFIDQGKPYDPLKKPDPDTTLSADEREIGGLGIFLTKKLTDKVEYRYENGKNILTLEKKLG